jgi:phage terminase small subunit
MSELNARQQTFVKEYLVDLNATKAAERAGYSKLSAKVHGCRLLTKANVAEEIERAQQKRAESLGITQEKVLKEMSYCGFSNMQDYMKATPEGDPYLDFSNLTREQTAALTEVTVEDYTEGRGKDAREVKKVRFKLADKLSALEKIGRHIGMFKNEEKQGGGEVKNLSLTLIQVLQAAAKQ